MKIGSVSAIGNITSVRSVSAVQKPDVKTVDTASKSIKDDITAVERQKQSVSPQTDISVDEKIRRRQELQQELSSLKTKLRMSETEARKERRKETFADEERSGVQETETSQESKAAESVKAEEKAEAAKAERQEAQIQRMKENASEGKAEIITARKQDADQDQAKEAEAVRTGTDGFKIEGRTEKADSADEDKKTEAEKDKEKAPGFSQREVRSMIEEDEAAERAKQQGVIVARIENDIVILKGEIKQDEDRDVDVTKKKEELKEQEERAQWATNAQFSAIGQTNKKLQADAQDKLEETRGESAMIIRRNAAEQPLIRATNYSLSGMV